jgi:hypothetical protein
LLKWNARKAAAQPRRCRANVEVLEDRVTPALTVADFNMGVAPADLVATILGSGVSVSNVRFTGTNVSAGRFSGGTGIIGFDCGIILSSGSAGSVIGPNVNDGITTVNGTPGDPDLDSLVSGSTFDATILEFDFLPSASVLTFQYVFASDEYNEFANTTFNDVFAFILNGVNVALIPGTSTPVSINNINGGNPLGVNAQNPQFYINNDPTDGVPTLDTEMDGMTVVLTVTANVIPFQINHIKLAIADRGDDVLDSNVFIKAGSFNAGTSSRLTAVGTDVGSPPHVKVYDGATLVHSFYAFDTNFGGGVRVAVADVSGDGTQDIIVGTGPGVRPHVKVFDGKNLALLYSFHPFTPGFLGGIWVAGGNTTGGRNADIIIGADAGATPHVKVFSGATGAEIMSFYAFDPGFKGGVRVAAGDVDGDGRADIVAGAGPGALPHVTVYSGFNGRLLRSFLAYDAAFRGGIYVACTSFTGTFADPCGGFSGHYDILTGSGIGSHVKVFDGRNLALLKSFFAGAGFLFLPDGNPNRSGVRVGAIDRNGDGRPEIVTSMAGNIDPIIRAYDSQSLAQIDVFYAFDRNFRAGVYISV